MPDAAASPVTLFPAFLTFSGALLAPIIGVVVGLLSRTSIQRRQNEVEYNIKRLELIDKIIVVGKSLSNHLDIYVDISGAQSEYFRIMASLTESEPPSVNAMLSFEQHDLPIRLFMLPIPKSMVGWIATFTYYINVLVAIFLLIAMFLASEVQRETRVLGEPFPIYLIILVLLAYMLVPLLIAVAARFWAIRVAKATMRRDREKFERETTPHYTRMMRKS
jgi:hypothetical protein